MPKIKIVTYLTETHISSYGDYGDNDKEIIRDTGDVILNWREVTDDDLAFIKANMKVLPRYKGYKVKILILDETPIPNTIQEIKDYILSENKKRAKDQEKWARESKERELEKTEKALARKKKQLEKLKAELGDK